MIILKSICKKWY